MMNQVELKRTLSLLLWILVTTTTTMVASLNGVRPSLSSSTWAHRSAVKDGICIKVASKEKGLGAFATSNLKRGDYIGENTGEVLTRRQVQARYWGKRAKNGQDLSWQASRSKRGQGLTGNFVLEMKDGSFVDSEDAELSSWCRFMNHATEGTKPCNVKPFDRLAADDDLLTFPQYYAIRDIQAGEELLFDYGPHSDVAQSLKAAGAGRAGARP
ncbi:hypothetical protein ACA910_019857 [Epithemia clementina (nom. ined.)]